MSDFASIRCNKFVSACVVGWLATAASAGPPPGGPRPLLEELDRETRALYHEVGPGVVRVQLPTTRGGGDDPLARWNDKLSPETRARLERERRSSVHAYVADILPPTRPSDEKLPPQQDAMNAPQEQPQGAPASRPAYGSADREPFVPNVMGVVLDDAGHLMVPTYVSKEDVGSGTVPVALDDGSVLPAAFVGSDRQTNMTVLQVHADGLRPMPLGLARPEDGSLVLVLTVDASRSRLGVWTSTATDSGLVVATDGTVLGFARRGQFLCAATCLPVVRQLVEHGRVERAYLGVRVGAVLGDDPERESNKALGMRPSIRVREVVPDSAAARAGLREGDLVLSLAGDGVGDPSAFAAAIAARRGKTELKVLRGEDQVTITVDLQPASPK